jgi:glutamine synthetase
LEVRFPDSSCNGYLLSAPCSWRDIQNKIVPPDPIDKDLYDLEAEEKALVKSTPSSLEDVLNSLEADHEFLLKGAVFTKDVI